MKPKFENLTTHDVVGYFSHQGNIFVPTVIIIGINPMLYNSCHKMF